MYKIIKRRKLGRSRGRRGKIGEKKRQQGVQRVMMIRIKNKKR